MFWGLHHENRLFESNSIMIISAGYTFKYPPFPSPPPPLSPALNCLRLRVKAHWLCVIIGQQGDRREAGDTGSMSADTSTPN